MVEFARFIAPFLAPLPMGVFCIFFALFCLLLSLKKTAVLSLLLSLAILLVSGYGLFTRQQLYQLERKYPSLDVEKIAAQKQRQIKFVVVLGSSNVTDPDVPESGQLGSASLYRLVEGIRIHQELPQTWLVFSGGANQDTRANAVVAGKVAESLGMDKDRMIIEDRPADTQEEAKLLSPVLRDTPFVLVTSAAHMDRAMKLFQEEGMDPIAAPTDFMLKDNKLLTSDKFLPSCENMGISQRMLYEWMAAGWAYLQKTAGF
ncbi:MAG: ElyC/SanA/YdcF family protein [Candidatus Electrothrix sp. YB6]